MERAARKLSEQCLLRTFRLTPSWGRGGSCLPVRKPRPQISKKARTQFQTLSIFHVLGLYTLFS